MKKMLFLLAFIVFVAQIGFAEGDGSSIENAIIIKNISNYEKCKTEDDISNEYGKSIDQERSYLDAKYGIRGKDWEYGMQGLRNVNDRHYDVITIKLLSPKKTDTIYFDVTEPLIILSELEEKRINEELPKDELLNIAVNKAKGLGYDIEKMNVIYDEGNIKLKEHCKRLGVSVYNKETKKWDKEEPSTPEKDFPVLTGRNYQAIYFSPKQIQKGGDLWIFVDKNTGEVIKWVGGE